MLKMAWWRGAVQKLSDSGCVVMGGLTECGDILGGRNKGNRSQRSASVRCEHLGGLGWARLGRSRLGWRDQEHRLGRVDFNMFL